MLDRWANIFFSLALVFVFILLGNAQDHRQILTAAFLAILLSMLAFILNWLTLDGAVASGIFGSIAYGLGGLAGATIVLGFFISGSILSKDLISDDVFLERKFRRDAAQVWSNGFWFTLWILIWFLAGNQAFFVAAVTAIASATSDTWATEVGGNRIKGKTWLITTREKVDAGTDGGISIYGTLAALTGAVFIGALYWLFEMNKGSQVVLIISITGFLGSMTDSYIGARFQNRNYRVPALSLFGIESLYVSNNFVNWISAGIASVISLVIILIISV